MTNHQCDDDEDAAAATEDRRRGRRCNGRYQRRPTSTNVTDAGHPVTQQQNDHHFTDQDDVIRRTDQSMINVTRINDDQSSQSQLANQPPHQSTYVTRMTTTTNHEMTYQRTTTNQLNWSPPNDPTADQQLHQNQSQSQVPMANHQVTQRPAAQPNHQSTTT